MNWERTFETILEIYFLNYTYKGDCLPDEFIEENQAETTNSSTNDEKTDLKSDGVQESTLVSTQNYENTQNNIERGRYKQKILFKLFY